MASISQSPLAMPRSGMQDQRTAAQKQLRVQDLRQQITHAVDSDIAHRIREFIPTVHLQFQFFDAFNVQNGYRRLLLASSSRIVNNANLMDALYCELPHPPALLPAAEISSNAAQVRVAKAARHNQLRRALGFTNEELLRGFLFDFFEGGIIMGLRATCWGCLRPTNKSYNEGRIKLCRDCVKPWLLWQKMGQAELDTLSIGIMSRWDATLPRITTPFSTVLLPDLFHYVDVNTHFALVVYGVDLKTLQAGSVSQALLRPQLLHFIIQKALDTIPGVLSPVATRRPHTNSRVRSWMLNFDGCDIDDVSRTALEAYQGQVRVAVNNKLRESGLTQLLEPSCSPALLGITWISIRTHIFSYLEQIFKQGDEAMWVLAGIPVQYDFHPISGMNEGALELLEVAHQHDEDLETLYARLATILTASAHVEAKRIWNHYRKTPQYDWMLVVEVAYHKYMNSEPIIDSFDHTIGTSDQDKESEQKTFMSIMQNDNITTSVDKLRFINRINASRILGTIVVSIKFWNALRLLDEHLRLFVHGSALTSWSSTVLGRLALANRYHPGFFDHGYPSDRVFRNEAETVALYKRPGDPPVHQRNACSDPHWSA